MLVLSCEQTKSRTDTAHRITHVTVIDNDVSNHEIVHLCVLQLVFVDLLNKNLYVTSDEGSTFVEYPVSFTPDRLLFHPTREKYILAYANNERTVSALFCIYLPASFVKYFACWLISCCEWPASLEILENVENEQVE